ncbi:MAG: hypothetical protein IH616_24195 [Gemmatimonadales bacterium]|nr:hypothetical protein [Gemmatimonadales bacterium]
MNQGEKEAVALIRRAIEKAGSNRALAQALSAPDSSISFWAGGKRPIPDDVIAELAVYLGEDPIKALALTAGGRWKRIAKEVATGSYISIASALIASALTWPTDLDHRQLDAMHRPATAHQKIVAIYRRRVRDKYTLCNFQKQASAAC